MSTADAASFVKQMAALGYYMHKNVFTGYCAKIADMTVEVFICFLGKKHVSIFQFENEAELARDFANA
jgi:hypothetical protein